MLFGEGTVGEAVFSKVLVALPEICCVCCLQWCFYLQGGTVNPSAVRQDNGTSHLLAPDACVTPSAANSAACEWCVTHLSCMATSDSTSTNVKLYGSLRLDQTEISSYLADVSNNLPTKQGCLTVSKIKQGRAGASIGPDQYLQPS